MAEPAIAVEGLGKRFGTFTALESVSLQVAEGEVFGLLGPNGAGKTTLTRILCGLLQPSEGSAHVLGLSVATGGSDLRSRVGLLTEQPGLYDRLTGWDNLRYFADLYSVSRADADARAEKYLSLFGIWDQRHLRAGTYSKGMRQKLAIARALLHAPRVIFFDEPTSGLDPVAARAVRDAVAALAREGRTIVLCSHNLDEVERLCARVAVLKQRVLVLAPVSELRRGRRQADIELGSDALPFAKAAEGAGVARVTTTGHTLTVELEHDEAISEVIRHLVEAHAAIRSVRPQGRALEEVYLDLVGTPGEKSA